MTRLYRIGLLILAALWVVSGSAWGQADSGLIAPEVFLRGLEIPTGVRYTASLLKSTDNAALANLSVEITLPASAELVEMIVPPQVQFDVIRRSRAGQLTLIWQISRVAADAPLSPFSFTVTQPLDAELEFYAQWIDETGEQQVENFFEQPPVIPSLVADAQITLEQSGFTLVDGMGVQAAAPDDALAVPVGVRLLSTDFNPPPQYGDFWWCSLLQVDGVQADQPITVIVPLRRPLAAFTPLGMFQQQANGSWSPLADQAVVTADGQFALYTHPGGVIATGVDAEQQPDLLSGDQLVIVDAPLEQPPLEQPPIEQPTVEQPTIEPPTSEPPQNPTLVPTTITSSELTNTPVPLPENATSTALLGDGTSNTIVVGQGTRPPRPTADTSAGFVTLAPFSTATHTPPAATPTSGIQDGSSNTLLIGEVTRTAAPTGDGSVRFVTLAPFTTATGTPPTPTSGIQDGSSNTLLIGEVTRTATSTGDGSVRFVTLAPFSTATGTPTNGIQDGSSNTILISEVTRTATSTGDGSVRFVTLAPFSTATNTPTSGIQDGSSNTILIGEVTRTATPTGDGSVRFVTLPLHYRHGHATHANQRYSRRQQQYPPHR
ncbi:MAG: hypothetical protein U0670_17510 [Anaerolineae bacterium]